MTIQEGTERLQQKIDSLIPLQQRLSQYVDPSEKMQFLQGQSSVVSFLAQHQPVARYLEKAPLEQCLAFLAVIAIGQGTCVLGSARNDADLKQLANSLAPVEHFYASIGGIVGYHVTLLRLMQGEDLGAFAGATHLHYSKPSGIDLHHESATIHEAVLEAIKSLPAMCEIYAVGGAGDRLNLFDEASGIALPAAKLRFTGHTLLEILIRDIQASEYLHFKLFGAQVTTPIAMMTSYEKDNHLHIMEICENADWFGRPRDSFFLFPQPLVPVVTEYGDWVVDGLGQLMTKPGGHGVIWKLAQINGVFDWLKSASRRKALIRQINNPVAGVDYGLLAFIGLGLIGNKSFGFASCDRRLNSPEGMDVLVEDRSGVSYEYRVTNIEYTDFAKRDVHDIPEQPDSPYSAFPANTNILFADLEVVNDKASTCPIPGMLVNMKTRIPLQDAQGKTVEVAIGRLESTMQNIADYIVDRRDHPLTEQEAHTLSTYVTYNHRQKTLSVTKNLLAEGKSPEGTPECCFYDRLQNYRDLLVNHCQFEMPPLDTLERMILDGPSFLVDTHPALGPLYSIIRQKMREGKLFDGSELQLEIAELDLQALQLDGSLRVMADAVMGHRDSQGLLVNSTSTGRCTLHQCSVFNKGVNWSKTSSPWTGECNRRESLLIHLEGNGEFVAHNVIFRGNISIDVKDGEKVTANQEQDGTVRYQREPLTGPSWSWKYSVGADHTITLQR